MNYRHVLFIMELGEDTRAALALIRRVAPAAEILVVVAHVAERQFAWLADEAPGELNQATLAALDNLREAAAGVAQRIEVKLASRLVAHELAELVEASNIDLLAAGPLPLSGINVLAALRNGHSFAVLWTGGAAAGDRPVTEIRCVGLGTRGRAAIASFLRDHGSPALHAVVAWRTPKSPSQLAAALDMAGITARVELVTLGTGLRAWLGGESGQAPLDLLVLTRFPGGLLPVTA